jgi:hypothetical protein
MARSAVTTEQAVTVAMCGPDDELDDAEGDVEAELELLFDTPPQPANAMADKTTAKHLSATDFAMAAVVSQGSGPMSTDWPTRPPIELRAVPR